MRAARAPCATRGVGNRSVRGQHGQRCEKMQSEEGQCGTRGHFSDIVTRTVEFLLLIQFLINLQ